MNQETKRWLDIANMDMGVAKHLMENYHPKPLEIICYHCQQAAEKAIKAKIEEKYFDYADTLTPYGVAVRYPNELFLEEHHAKEAIQYAEEIIQWVYRQL